MNAILIFISKHSLQITVISCSICLYSRISSVDVDIGQRIESTINRLMPMSRVDTSRVIQAPQLNSIGSYYYFKGKVIGNSVKVIDEFEYNVSYPREIWDGYITVVKGNNGANYYMWSENKIIKNIEISLWTIADPHLFEIGYHRDKTQKLYGQILYPIVSVKTANIIN